MVEQQISILAVLFRHLSRLLDTYDKWCPKIDHFAIHDMHVSGATSSILGSHARPTIVAISLELLPIQVSNKWSI